MSTIINTRGVQVEAGETEALRGFESRGPLPSQRERLSSGGAPQGAGEDWP